MKFGLSETVIQELQKVFSLHTNIKQVLIFGSRAKGNYHEGSDIDLALVGEDITPVQLDTIRLQIDDLELLYSVDILSYKDREGTAIAEHIDRVGQVFYQR